MFSYKPSFRVPERFKPKNPSLGNESYCGTCSHALVAEAGYLCKRHMEHCGSLQKGFYGCGYSHASEEKKRELKHGGFSMSAVNTTFGQN